MPGGVRRAHAEGGGQRADFARSTDAHKITNVRYCTLSVGHTKTESAALLTIMTTQTSSGLARYMIDRFIQRAQRKAADGVRRTDDTKCRDLLVSSVIDPCRTTVALALVSRKERIKLLLAASIRKLTPVKNR